MAEQPVPESVRALRRQLNAAERGYQGELARRLLLAAVPWALAAVLVTVLLDMALHLRPTSRLGCVLAGLAAVLALLGRAGYVAWTRRRRDEAIARHLEQADRSLGSSLINSLQLADQATDPASAAMTRQLAARALGDYQQRRSKVDWAGCLRRPLPRRLWWAAGAALGLWAILAISFHGITWLELARFGDPFGDHPPFSLTKLAIAEPGENFQVVYGQSLLVKVNWQGHDPGEVLLSFHDPATPGQVSTLPMFNKGELGFVQQIENVKTPLVLVAHTANHHAESKQRTVGIILTPRVDKAFVEVTAPAYTCRSPVERPWTFQNVKALAGSTVRFRLQSNRPLGGGTIGLAGTVSHDSVVSMKPTAEQEVTGTIVATESGRLRFTVTDVAGNESHELMGGSITVVQDLPPQVVIVNPERDSFITEDFKLEAEISASDDYGIAELRLHRALNGRYSAPKVFRYDDCKRSVREVELFDIRALGVRPGDRISFFADVLDTCPDPHLAASRVVNLVVVGVEEYNQFLRERMAVEDIRQKYQQLVKEIRDLAEEQRQLNEEIERLREELASGKAPNPDELQDRLNELIQRQNELNEKIGKEADRLEEFGRDEPVYDIEKEFRQFLKETAKALRDSTAANGEALSKFGKQSGRGSELESLRRALSDLKQDGERQFQKLGGQADAVQQDVVETVEDLSKMNQLIRDFNQFEMLYQEQCAIARQARAYDVARDLSTADKLALRRLASREKAIADLLPVVVRNLRRHAEDAKATFPKASQAAVDLADQIEEARLEPLAKQTSNTMLIPDGPGSYRLAERLRQEMEKLFTECNGGGSCCSNDLDSYLRLYLQMNPGRTYEQMKQSLKRGGGYAYGFGIGQGRGSGAGDGSGYAVPGPNVGLLGNETLPGEGDQGQTSPRAGAGAGPGNPTGAVAAPTEIDRHEHVADPEATLESTRPVPVEAPINQYKELVDRYFQKIIEADKE